MKRIWQFALLIVCALAVTACNDDDDKVKVDEVWKEKNRVAFVEISGNKEYKEIKSASNGGSIYYKVIKEGNGTEQIYYTDQVKVYYTGWLIDAEKPTDFFDKAEPPYQPAATFKVSGLTEGFATALQWMKEGDRWEVWVPYQLGYGENGNSSIPGYSTLKFEIEVVEIVR